MATATLTETERRDGERLLATIAGRHGLTVEELLARNHDPHRAEAHRALYRTLRRKKWSFPKIASLVGREHSTVIQALRRHRGRPSEQQLDRDELLELAARECDVVAKGHVSLALIEVAERCAERIRALKAPR